MPVRRLPPRSRSGSSGFSCPRMSGFVPRRAGAAELTLVARTTGDLPGVATLKRALAMVVSGGLRSPASTLLDGLPARQTTSLRTVIIRADPLRLPTQRRGTAGGFGLLLTHDPSGGRATGPDEVALHDRVDHAAHAVLAGLRRVEDCLDRLPIGKPHPCRWRRSSTAGPGSSRWAVPPGPVAS